MLMKYDIYKETKCLPKQSSSHDDIHDDIIGPNGFGADDDDPYEEIN